MTDDSGLRVAEGGTGRCFKIDGPKIAQSTEAHPVGPFQAEFGPVKGKLEIKLGLSYVAVVDPGHDRLICRLSIERPSQWMGSDAETLILEREFLYLHAVVDWLLGLEELVMSALFNVRHENDSIIKDKEIIRVLLAIVDQLKPLQKALAADEAIRRKMLK